MEINHNIMDSSSKEILFTANINCDENCHISWKKRLAVLWAVRRSFNLRGADLRGACLKDAHLKWSDLMELVKGELL